MELEIVVVNIINENGYNDDDQYCLSRSSTRARLREKKRDK